MFAQSTTLGKQLANNASFSTSSSSSKKQHQKKIDVKVSASNVKRNPNMAQLRAGYLFPEIARIRNAHLEKNPDAKIISLGIGDTTVGFLCVYSLRVFEARKV
jgi:LL-diaminopimelate aminotransferase